MLPKLDCIRIAKRVSQMDREELQVRARQEIAKRWDRVLNALGVDLVGARGDVHPSGRFFFTRQSLPYVLDLLRERVPDAVEQIIQQAQQICRHKFDLLGYEGLDYGTDIDWLLDTVHGKRAPLRPWYKIRFLDFDEVGDSKITWELNRHQHLVTLAKAYLLSGKAEYAKELFRQWYDWQQKNPYGLGINWASSLEVAFRSLSWLWVWYLLDGSDCLPTRFSADLSRALALNAKHIEQFLSTYFSPNTHLLGEGVGLLFIGTLVPDLPNANRWQHIGWDIILRQAQRQVQQDGMHFEQSTYYHVYALDFLLHSRVLAGVNGLHVPLWFDRTIDRMLNVVCALGCNGSLPRLGDDDGGRVFDPRRNRAEYLVDPLAAGAILYERGDFKAVAKTLREESIWLFGLDGARRFDELQSCEPECTSRALHSSGIYLMADGTQPSNRMIVDAGPHGFGTAGHAHSDALSVQLSVAGEPVLIDPGTSTYVYGPERDYFRGTAGHNTVNIDAAGQAEAATPFSWKALPNIRVERWAGESSFDFFEGTHDGFRRLEMPVRHRRTIYFAKPSFWLIRDILEGTGTHDVEQFWHFAHGSLFDISGGLKFVNDAAVALLFASERPFSRSLRNGLHAPAYGKKEPCHTVVIRSRAELPIEIASAIVPLANAGAPAGALMRLTAQHSNVMVYRYACGSRSDYMFFSQSAAQWQFERWAGDAHFAFCSIDDENDKLLSFGVCDGKQFVMDGRRLFSSATQTLSFEQVLDPETSATPSLSRVEVLEHAA